MQNAATMAGLAGAIAAVATKVASSSRQHHSLRHKLRRNPLLLAP
jgi:hypothetical protein